MKRLTGGLVILMVFVLVAAGSAWSGEVEVPVKKITEAQAPKIDGKVDKIWDKVRAKKVTASEGPQGEIKISVKALYTDSHVYLFFRWPDKTKSLNRLYEFTGTEWKKVKGNEDRFNLGWDINNNIKDFPTKGCEAACHKEEGKKGEKEKVTFKTDGPDQKLDIWHWKAQRSNPAGYADDQWMADVLKQKGDETTARGSDAKTAGSYSKNFDKKAKRPKYTAKPGVKLGPTLLKKEAVKVTDATKFKAGNRLPREVLAKPVGSRGDIEAKARYARNRWTLEMKRARDTGDKAHDVQLTDPGRPYYFGISVHDNQHESEHSYTAGTALKLMLK